MHVLSKKNYNIMMFLRVENIRQQNTKTIFSDVKINILFYLMEAANGDTLAPTYILSF